MTTDELLMCMIMVTVMAIWVVVRFLYIRPIEKRLKKAYEELSKERERGPKVRKDFHELESGQGAVVYVPNLENNTRCKHCIYNIENKWRKKDG